MWLKRVHLINNYDIKEGESFMSHPFLLLKFSTFLFIIKFDFVQCHSSIDEFFLMLFSWQMV